MTESKSNTAETIAKLAREKEEKPFLIKTESSDGLDIDILARPAGNGAWNVESIKKLADEWRINPERRKGTAVLTDLQSFVDHVNRFKSEHSAIFVDRTPIKPSLLCVFDYHEKGYDGDPRFCEHRARYDFPLSDEWIAWQAMNGTTMDQGSFANFLEDRILDVMDPAGAGEAATEIAERLGLKFASPSRLLELSRGLSIRVGMAMRQAVNTSSGEARFSYEEQHSHEHGGPLDVPGAFLLALRVFKLGEPYQLPARLRYRAAGGGNVTWHYNLTRVDMVIDHAIQEAAAEAQAKTEIPAFGGKPEA